MPHRASPTSCTQTPGISTSPPRSCCDRAWTRAQMLSMPCSSASMHATPRPACRLVPTEGCVLCRARNLHVHACTCRAPCACMQAVCSACIVHTPSPLESHMLHSLCCDGCRTGRCWPKMHSGPSQCARVVAHCTHAAAAPMQQSGMPGKTAEQRQMSASGCAWMPWQQRNMERGYWSRAQEEPAAGAALHRGRVVESALCRQSSSHTPRSAAPKPHRRTQPLLATSRPAHPSLRAPAGGLPARAGLHTETRSRADPSATCARCQSGSGTGSPARPQASGQRSGTRPAGTPRLHACAVPHGDAVMQCCAAVLDAEVAAEGAVHIAGCQRASRLCHSAGCHSASRLRSVCGPGTSSEVPRPC
jgi:hypothetical protein